MPWVVVIVAVTALVHHRLRGRWAQRGIPATSRDIAISALAAAVGGIWIAVSVNSWSGLLMAAWLQFAVLACLSDVRVRLVPSGAAWWACVTGGGVLLLHTLTGGLSTGEVFTLAMWGCVVFMFTVLTVAGAMGGGDVRAVIAAAATLWFVPALPLLVGLLVGLTVTVLLMAVRRHRAVPLMPVLLVSLTAAALVGVAG
ncbi:MAG: hypothetical protein QG661_2438 [Actinomycetota bacterium]|jgi:hypothetical protein|nr:hypothetical protein [Actinomycetota bacterium]